MMTIKCLSIKEKGLDIQINLCDSCCNFQPECNPRNMIFGTGVGDDNVCACDGYEPITLRPHRDDFKSMNELGVKY